MPVIFFHAHLESFSGGFVGVGVFFVISGYLMTTLIVGELESGTFSIVTFYERRVRRILPALYVVLAACIPVAWICLFPDQIKDFAQSVVAVSLFSANFLFYVEADYFDQPTELKPLLHTWSLGVEEQFYLLFPGLLILLFRRGPAGTALVLSAGGLCSLAFSEWAWRNWEMGNFYLPFSRMWELLIGAVVGVYLGRKTFPASMRQIGSAMGIALIATAVLWFDRQTPFPSLYALVPTTGAALVILCADKATLIGRILSTRPFVAIGLISYSAYLWHQPIFAFVRISSVHEPSAGVFLLLAAVSLILAFFTWRYVEQPFRNRQYLNRQQIFQIAVATSFLVVGSGVAGTLFARDAKIAQLQDRFQESNLPNRLIIS